MKRLVDLGPGSLETIFAELDAQRESADRVYDYMDFYMGTQMIGGRADLTPVYRMIFRRLRAADCDWRYSFPRMFLADLRPLRDALREEQAGEPAWSDYDPSAALAAADDDSAHDIEIADVRAKLDEAYRESVEAAKDQSPPRAVAAYRDVYGSYPAGWPPEIDH